MGIEKRGCAFYWIVGFLGALVILVLGGGTGALDGSGSLLIVAAFMLFPTVFFFLGIVAFFKRSAKKAETREAERIARVAYEAEKKYEEMKRQDANRK